ncbi:hypothetical protein BJF79_07650 [Actinomadura sp. CNU-125]|nr:hypothetical protein BJF79_07650 [Actinomadura sp. CNU-125]
MSAAMRMVVSGVRSSCETSETNWRCTCDRSSSSRIFSWRFSAISLNERARRARSSSPRTRMRSSSRPAARRWAPCAASRTGMTTWRVTREAIAARRRTRTIPTPTRERSTVVRVSCSCSRENR